MGGGCTNIYILFSHIFRHHLPGKSTFLLENNDNYRDTLYFYRSCFAASLGGL